MASTQSFLAQAAIRSAKDLEEALVKIPRQKWDWRASDTSRSALHMVAECAVINHATIDMITTRTYPWESVTGAFGQEIDELAEDGSKLQILLHETAAHVAAVIRAVPDDELEKLVVLPWETAPLAEVMAYPYWNMTYHLGQINFIASVLGVLK